jgi:formylglycine-generating enzyme
VRRQQCLCVLAALGLVFGTTAQADVIVHGGTSISIDFVNIGNAGNASDDTGFGAVGYNYRMGKYEVTAAQWAAVVGADSSIGDAGPWSGSQPTASISWYSAAKFCNLLTTGNANSGVYDTRT